MADPVTLTVGAIIALAFTKFLESSAQEAAKEITPAVLDKISILRKKIFEKLRGIPEANEINNNLEKGKTLTEQQINLLTPHLEAAMKMDDGFAQEIRQIASEINQEINISELLGEHIQNVYGGSAVQINDPNAPVLTGDISGGTFNFNTTNTTY